MTEQNVGWVCPVCKSVHAPFVVGCSCSQGFQTSTNKTLEVEHHIREALMVQKLEALAARIDDGDFDNYADIVAQIQTIIKSIK